METIQGMFQWVLRSSGQTTVLILLVLLAQWVFGSKLSPRWRSGLWMLVLIRLLIPVSLPSQWSVFNLTRTAQSSMAPGLMPPVSEKLPVVSSHEVSRPPENVMDAMPVKERVRPVPVVANSVPLRGNKEQMPAWNDFRRAIPLVWLVVAALLVMRTAIRCGLFGRYLRQQPSTTEPWLLEMAQDCRQMMGIKQSIRIVTNETVKSPALFGLLRPCLLLPAEMVGNFSRQDLRFVIMHEMAHVKRKDLWVHWLMTIASMMHWFNPLVWLTWRRMSADRELACDAMVMSYGTAEENQAYGLTIIKVLERFAAFSKAPGMVGILEDKTFIFQRIKAIGNFSQARHWSLLAMILFFGMAVVGLTDAQTKLKSSQELPKKMTGENDDKVSNTNTIQGRVVNELGRPLSGINIRRGVDKIAVTDEDGRFVIRNAPQKGIYRFILTNNPPTIHVQEVPAYSSEQTVIIRNAITVTCKVFDAATRQPIKNAHIVHGWRREMGEDLPRWNWSDYLSQQTDHNGSFILRLNHPTLIYEVFQLLVEAEGYTPIISPVLFFTDAQTITFPMTPGQPIKGTIIHTNGQPVQWADIFLWMGEGSLYDVPPHHRQTTGASGEFSFEPALFHKFVVTGSGGFAELSPEEFYASPNVMVHPGGKVTGTLRWGKKPVAKQTVFATRIRYPFQQSVDISDSISAVETDWAGRFTIDRLPQGEYWISVGRIVRESESIEGQPSMVFEKSHAVPIVVKSAATINVDLGGMGRAVIGNFDTNVFSFATTNLDAFQGVLMLMMPPVDGLSEKIFVHNGIAFKSIMNGTEAVRTFRLSPEGRARHLAERKYWATFSTDGSVRFEDVPAGDYFLSISIPQPPRKRRPEAGGPIQFEKVSRWTLNKKITIPEMPRGRSDEPLDLGTLELTWPKFNYVKE